MKRIGIVANLDKSNAVSVTRKVLGFFKSRKVEVFLEQPLARALNKPELGLPLDRLARKVDLVIALGGDGTFLRVARVIQKQLKPILGVNLGGLGFLSEVTLNSLEKGLRLLVKGRYNISYRMTLNIEVIKGKGKKVKVQPALNDVVISKRALSRIISLETYIDKEYVTTYRADGVIIATPTGSTAYTLSAGGPIIYPGADVILVAPICPHTLTHRPLVVPSKSKVRIRLGTPAEDVVLTVDGQVGVDIMPDDIVVVSRGAQKVPLVVFEDTSYFEVLRQKLYWGGR